MIDGMIQSMIQDKQDMMVDTMVELTKGELIKDDIELSVLLLNIYDTKLPKIAKIALKPERFITECLKQSEFFKAEVRKKVMRSKFNLVE